MGSAPSDRYYIPLPVWAEGNVYMNGASPWDKEKAPAVVEDAQVRISVKEEEGWAVCTNLKACMPEGKMVPVDTEKLGMAFEPEEKYENPDGTPIRFEEDDLVFFRNWTVRDMQA